MKRGAVLVLVLMLVVACVKKPFQNMPIDDLELRVLPRGSAITVGQPTEIEYVLVNIGEATIDACITESWSFGVAGFELDNLGEMHVVDHPSCDRLIVVAAGEEIRWVREVDIPAVSAGEGGVFGSIQLVDPHNCHRRYGCYARHLSSEIVAVKIRE